MHVLREGHMGNAPSPVFFTLPIQRPRYKLCNADSMFAFSCIHHPVPCLGHRGHLSAARLTVLLMPDQLRLYTFATTCGTGSKHVRDMQYTAHSCLYDAILSHIFAKPYTSRPL